MRIIIYLILLIVPLISSGQYYDCIYKAEQYILNSEYEKAQEEYISAFDKYETGRASDYLNLVICSNYLGDSLNYIRYIDSCFISGYRSSDIISIFENTSNNYSKKDLTEQADSLFALYLANKQSEEYLRVDELRIKDSTLTLLFVAGQKDRYTLYSGYYAIGKEIAQMIHDDLIPHKELFHFNSGIMRSTIPWSIIRHYFGMINNLKQQIKEGVAHKEFYLKVLNDSSFYKELVGLIDRGLFPPHILRDGLVYSNPKEFFGKTTTNIIVTYKKGKQDGYSKFEDLNIVQELIYKEEHYNGNKILFFNENRIRIHLSTYEHEMNLSILEASNKIDKRIKNDFEFNYGKKIRPSFYDNKKYKLIKEKDGGVKLVGRVNDTNKWEDVEVIEEAKVIIRKL